MEPRKERTRHRSEGEDTLGALRPRLESGIDAERVLEEGETLLSGILVVTKMMMMTPIRVWICVRYCYALYFSFFEIEFDLTNFTTFT